MQPFSHPFPADNYGASKQGVSSISQCGIGAATVKSPEISALEQFAQRIQSLAVRLRDTNYNTSAFVDRVTGPKATKPEVNVEPDGGIRPAISIIHTLLDRLENHVYEAEVLSRELARIG